MVGLAGDEGFDQRVGRLRVQRQSVLQRLQLLALVQIGLLQSISVGMEVEFDRFECLLQNGTVLWRQVFASLYVLQQ